MHADSTHLWLKELDLARLGDNRYNLRGCPRLEINEGTSSSGVAIKAFLARLLVKLIIFGQSFIIVHCLQVTGPICGRTSKKITDVLDNLLAQIRWSST